MNMNVNNTQLTVFGKFDSLEATPEIVTRLFVLFKEDSFLPSFTQAFQVNPQTNDIKSIKMPLMNGQQNDNCIISFLPERMDIKISGKISQLCKYCNYFRNVLSDFSIRPTRLAINTNRTIVDVKSDEIEAIGKKLIHGEAFPYKSFFEWGIRRVSREACSEEITELINICENIQLIQPLSPTPQAPPAIVVDTDINTLVGNVSNALVDKTELVFEGMKKHDDKLEAALKTALEGIKDDC